MIRLFTALTILFSISVTAIAENTKNFTKAEMAKLEFPRKSGHLMRRSERVHFD